MSFGVTPTGFNRKTLADSLSEKEAGWRAIFGPDVDLSADSPDGQIVGLFAGAEDEVWQAMAAIYASFRPRQATGAGQSDLVGLNGLTRKPGTPTVTTATIATTGGAANLTTAHRFESQSGDLFRPTTAGSYADASVISLTSIENAAITVTAGETWRIVTPVAGLNSVTSVAAVPVLGSLTESDGVLRTRQVVSTENGASNIIEALYAAVLQVTGVSAVRIYVNDTNLTVDLRPPHSYEVVVSGGSDSDVADAIWGRHPGGITMFGSTPIVIVDSQGFNQTINFTRPTLIPIIVNIVVSSTADYPATGDADMKQAIVDYANGVLVEDEGFGIGDDVLLSRLYTPINSIPGHNVTTLQIGDPILGTLDLVIDEIEIASFVIANITVTS